MNNPYKKPESDLESNINSTAKYGAWSVILLITFFSFMLVSLHLSAKYSSLYEKITLHNMQLTLIITYLIPSAINSIILILRRPGKLNTHYVGSIIGFMIHWFFYYATTYSTR